MSEVLAWGSRLASTAAALGATPVALWLRLRAGRRDAGALVLGVFLVAQLAALGRVTELWAGRPAWLGWSLGISGLAALAAAPQQEGSAERAVALALGLFGIGHLLRRLAAVAANGPG